MSMKKNGFVHSGVSKFEDANFSPIYGYRDLPVTTLEEAVKDVAFYVPGVEAYADKAKEFCKKQTHLTLDESAAIYLYTMATPFHSKLNDKLRAENREELVPCLAFLKLFMNALRKLPSIAKTVWRGVSSDISRNFFANDMQTWWTVNSCSADLKVIEFYVNAIDGKGTVFSIEAVNGKDVAKYSAFPEEQEVILMPGTRVHLKSQPLEIKDRPFIVSFEEW